MFYRFIASLLSAIFIAAVYYLIVLFQFPSVPLTSGFWLGGIIALFGIIRFILAKTKGKKSDAKVIVTTGVLLVVATYVLLFIDFQI